DHLTSLQKFFPDAIRWTRIQTLEDENLATILKNSRVMIVDVIGLLSRLYQYATICYIGGGFGKGIHNTLEAAVYGKPVIFGPAHQKFREAIELTQSGGTIPIADADDCKKAVKRLLDDQQAYRQACESAKKYVWANRGATGIILEYIQEKRLLTN
ncbi:MAG TPA: 3-deoxy-D-manno-octulosonic acid transferase, partial [Chitinophagaceae bacterium]|nr:3-deoxy-D-manno-octulosonic acid transferase [Chitinophagaceae bacterium]